MEDNIKEFTVNGFDSITDVRTSETQVLDTSWEISGEKGSEKLHLMSSP